MPMGAPGMPPPVPPPPPLQHGMVKPPLLPMPGLGKAGPMAPQQLLLMPHPGLLNVLQPATSPPATSPPAAKPAPAANSAPKGGDAVPANTTGKQFPWEGTSGIQCKYGRACKNSQCTDTHPSGRGIDEDPNSTICRFGRKCKRQGCFFVHPQGREVDDDPTKGLCRQGVACKRPDCLYSHPEGRVVEGQESRACHVCGIAGHLMKDCPKRRGIAALPLVKGQYVSLTDFAAEWESKTTEELTIQLTEELEVFGTLTLAPVLIDGHRKAVGAFEEEEAAKAAMEALESVLTMEMSDPPVQNVADGKPGSVLIKDFPRRWQASDIGALLHGTVKPSSLLGIEMVPGPGEDEGGNRGGARVRMRDFATAREAAKELQGQKVAGKPLHITLEDEDGNSHDIDDNVEPEVKPRQEFPDRRVDGIEMCQDYRMDRCTRGDRCKFSHGEDDSDEKKARLEKERKRREEKDRDKDRERRRRSRSRSRRRSRSRGKKAKTHIIHIDELKMTNRPDVEPAPTDTEIFADPLPEEDLMDTCLNAFGSTEEIYVLPSGPRRGYVKFTEHAAASRAVQAGFGSWSESERVLSSQRSKKDDRTIATYPDSIIARLVGSRGDGIKKLQEESGAVWIHLRGEDLGHSDYKFSSSQRVHFIAEADDAVVPKLKEALERRMYDIHENIIQTLKEKAGTRRPEFEDPWMAGPPHPPPPGWGWGPPPPDPWGAPPPWGPPPPGWG